MKNGIVGENTLLGGPLSQENRPHGKGSSYGKDGMKLNKFRKVELFFCLKLKFQG